MLPLKNIIFLYSDCVICVQINFFKYFLNNPPNDPKKYTGSPGTLIPDSWLQNNTVRKLVCGCDRSYCTNIGAKTSCEENIHVLNAKNICHNSRIGVLINIHLFQFFVFFVKTSLTCFISHTQFAKIGFSASSLITAPVPHSLRWLHTPKRGGHTGPVSGLPMGGNI